MRTEVAGTVLSSNIASNGNMLTALASSLEAANSLMLDGTSVRTTGALVNSQDSKAEVIALIGNSGTPNAGGVVVAIGENITNSSVSVAGNSATGQALGNTASNMLSVSATSLDADGANVAATAGLASGNYAANADYALTSDQSVAVGSASNATVYATFAIDQAADQVTTNATLAVDGNAQVAEAMANTVTNRLNVSATDMDVTGDTSASLANRQSGTANVDANSDMEVFANVQSATSTITMDGNSNRAIGVINNAANSMTVSGTNIAGTGSRASVTTATLATGSFALNNSQTAGGTLDTTATANIYNNDKVDTASTGIDTGSVSIANNLNFAESTANRATNGVSVDGGASNAAPAALANNQFSSTTVNATASSVFGTTLNGTASTTAAVNGSAVSVAGNTTQALARGNTATNAMVFTAGADFGTNPTDANAASTDVAGAAAVLNKQTNTGGVFAGATATYNVALNGIGSGTFPTKGVNNSAISVSGNTVAAAAFGNQATNRIELAVLNSGNATAAFNNIQSNTGAIRATATAVAFTSSVNGSVTNGAYRNIGNAASATAVGNSAVTFIGGR